MSSVIVPPVAKVNPGRSRTASGRLAPRAGSGTRLDVGFVHIGNHTWAQKLVGTLQASDPSLAMRLFVVDNANVGSPLSLESNCSLPVTHLRNERSRGYAANGNRILQAASAPYVLLLNTDLYFEAGSRCVTKMVDFMNRHPQCGAAVCRVLHPAGDEAYSARRWPTVPMILGRRLPGLGRLLFGRAVDRYLYRDREVLSSFPCDWISGCFMIMRRSAVLEAGGFDERYGKYFEDVDLCFRLAQAGWEIRYHGDAHCYHVEQRGSRFWWSRDAVRHLRAYGLWLAKRRRLTRMYARRTRQTAPAGVSRI